MPFSLITDMRASNEEEEEEKTTTRETNEQRGVPTERSARKTATTALRRKTVLLVRFRRGVYEEYSVGIYYFFKRVTDRRVALRVKKKEPFKRETHKQFLTLSASLSPLRTAKKREREKRQRNPSSKAQL